MKMQAINLWNKVLIRAQQELSEANYQTIMLQTVVGDMTDNKLEIICANTFVKMRFEKLFKDLVISTLKNEGHQNVTLITIVGDIKATLEQLQNIQPEIKEEKTITQTQHVPKQNIDITALKNTIGTMPFKHIDNTPQRLNTFIEDATPQEEKEEEKEDDGTQNNEVVIVDNTRPIQTNAVEQLTHNYAVRQNVKPLIAPRTNNLNPNYTFENFIMGANNQLAFSIAQAVAENPGITYNPFFIYSGVGLGKTHLMQSIGHKIAQNNPEIKIMYCTGESFMNDFIEAIKSQRGAGKYTSKDFRNKYRKADVLLIDDIQFIAGKEATQDEFFHTFNALQMAQKQIVITSDRPPQEFTNIEDRIRSRFGSGITADMQKPDIETRIAILRSKRDRDGGNMSNDVIDVLAEHISSNVRELEGAYLQVIMSARSTHSPITIEFAKTVLQDTLKAKRKKPLTINTILKTVCTYFDVTMGDVKGKRRTQVLVVPRQIAMYLMHSLTETPFTSIGDFFGGRDHTTVIHGVRKIEEEINQNGKLREDIIKIKDLLNAEV
ncbi:MAG: chromosomal replication initiator protein DnaA [Patescibacteria group bacterium]|uniref:Chromosomal replication initiator protein DnaA n=1 Tax=candidate division WWE3 bacterium TaxID=2053526 RepID=A0A955EBM7_UNCKA|nr:chromosomal replication initiator protein DnaA [candidate division WWE3 bacterium]